MYHPRVFIMDIFSWNRSSSIYEHQNLKDFNPITLQIQKERESLHELKVIMWLFPRFYCSCDMLPFQWQLSVWGKKIPCQRVVAIPGIPRVQFPCRSVSRVREVSLRMSNA